MYPRLLANVNGDGKADIVTFASDGVYVSLAAGGGHFASPALALSAFGANASAGGWISQSVLPRELADVNGDGRANIVGFGADGVSVALRPANGTFAPAQADIQAFGSSSAAGSWASQDVYPRILADVTGDHRADIVAFGSDGTFVSQSHDFFTV